MSAALIFLLYVLPLLNVVVLLTVNKKVKLKFIILMVTATLNVLGLSMLNAGKVADELTRGRELFILTFFTLVELLLVVVWSRKPKNTTKEDARDQ